MSFKLKQWIVSIILVITVGIISPGSNFGAVVHAAEPQNEKFILVDNDKIKVTVNNMYLRSGGSSYINAGYNMDLEIVNKSGDTDYLINLLPDKINGKTVGSLYSHYGLLVNSGSTINISNNNYVRVNKDRGVNKPILRTAVISTSLMSYMGVSNVEQLSGHFIVTDYKKNPIGSYGFDFDANTGDVSESSITKDAFFSAQLTSSDAVNNGLAEGESFTVAIKTCEKNDQFYGFYYDVENNTDKSDISYTMQVVTNDECLVSNTVSSTGISYDLYSSINNADGNSIVANSIENEGSTFDMVFYIRSGDGNELARKTITGVSLYGIPVSTENQGHSYSNDQIIGDQTAYISDEAKYYRLGYYLDGGGMIQYVDNSYVTWTSTDESIAEIDSDGRLTAKKAGVITLTAKSEYHFATMIVEVKEATLKLNKTEAVVGGRTWINYQVFPDMWEEDRDIRFESSNEAVLKISEDNNYLIGVSEGYAKVSAVYTTGAGIPITSEPQIVRVIPLTNVSFSKEKLNMVYDPQINYEDEDDGYWVNISTNSGDIDYDSATITAADESIVGWYRDINGVAFYPKKVGTTTVTVNVGNESDEMEVVVTDEYVDDETEDEIPSVEEKNENPKEEIGDKANPTKNPNANGYLYDGDDLDVKLKNAGYDSKGYYLNLQIDNNLSSTETIYVSINSVNGLVFNKTSPNYSSYFWNQPIYAAHGSSVHKMYIYSRTFALLRTQYINSIEGTINDYGSVQIDSGFTITPGEGTAYVRERSGGAKVIDVDDATSSISLEVANITEYPYDQSADVTVYVENKSEDKTITIDMFVDEINGEDVTENIAFISDGYGYKIAPGQKMYGTFTIPEKTYKAAKEYALQHNFKNAVHNMTVNATARYVEDGTQTDPVDKTITVDTSNVPVTTEELIVQGNTALYVNESPTELSVFEPTARTSLNSNNRLNNKKLTWSSTNTEVAVVSNDGKVYPKAVGTAMIKVTDGTRWGMHIIEVGKDAVIFSNNTGGQNYSHYIGQGSYAKLEYTIHPDKSADYSKAVLESGDENIVRIIDRNHILGIDNGTTTVTVKYTNSEGDELTDTCNVIVSSINRIFLSTDLMNLETDESRTLYARSDFGSLYEADWEVEDPSIVKIVPYDEWGRDNDDDYYYDYPEGYKGAVNVIPLKEGQTTIYAYYEWYRAECIVTVSGPEFDEPDEPEPDTSDPVKPDNKPSEEQSEKPAGATITDPNTGASYSITPDGGVKYEAVNNSKATKVVIPDSVTIDGKTYPVTSVSANAFKNNNKVTQVVLGKNVTKIETSAFQNAKNLKSVNLTSSSVETIQKNAFKGCKNLKNIKLNGNTLKKVEKGAFKGIKKGAKVTIAAKDKKTFNKVVKKIEKSGLKSGSFKFKKKKK